MHATGQVQRQTIITWAVLFGVPQGTIFRLLLYIHYVIRIFNIIAQYRVDAHQYADDLCIPRQKHLSLVTVSMCVSLTSKLVESSWLRLNPSKVRVMWHGSAQQLSKVWLDEVPVLSSQVWVIETDRNFSIVVYSQRSMPAHCSSLSWWLLSAPATREMFDRQSHQNTEVCVSVQDAAACLVTGLDWQEHSPLLACRNCIGHPATCLTSVTSCHLLDCSLRAQLTPHVYLILHRIVMAITILPL